MLSDHGVQVDRKAKRRAILNEAIIDKALSTVRRSFALYDQRGDLTHQFEGDNIHFTPGSAAINILDHGTGKMRKPQTRRLHPVR